MYIETSRPRKDSPFFNVVPKNPYGITNPPAYCLGFFYHMYRKHIENIENKLPDTYPSKLLEELIDISSDITWRALETFWYPDCLKQKGQTTTEGPAWSLSGNQGDRWKQAKVSIHPTSSFQPVMMYMDQGTMHGHH
ncbi:hypothetical protein NHX12_026303 [Muraenolepis orangiensis]|uniref:Uncharacterized protein n=1 Tax=Muraenolepis orangiensis TaxID=630683 RepID=A0A9Q0EGA7_9TELE|nr:hypothetical protein NHX12_026303 [Muraenolepis orangiensis]